VLLATFACVHSYNVSIDRFTNQEFPSVSKEIPIQIYQQENQLPESYQKIARLEIKDNREYNRDIQKLFFTNCLEQMKKTARDLGAHGIAFLSLNVKKINHPPGEYELYNRFGKKTRMLCDRSFVTYKFELQGIAIRYKKRYH
jgi:hypothetical protein